MPALSEKLTGPENVRATLFPLSHFVTASTGFIKKKRSCKPEYPGYKDMCTEDINTYQNAVRWLQERAEEGAFGVYCKSDERRTHVVIRHVTMKVMISRWGEWERGREAE